MGSKEAVMVVLDVGKNMEGGFFKEAQELLLWILHRQIFAETGKELGLVLLGSQETQNALAESGGFAHVAAVHDLQLPDFGLVNLVQGLTTSGEEGDCSPFWSVHGR